MEPSPGKQMGLAMRAVANMHSDCLKLFSDLDKNYPALKSFYGNHVTMDMGRTIGRRMYLAEGLIRLYHLPNRLADFLSINICFFDLKDPKFSEPLFVVARICYEEGAVEKSEQLRRGWDPWFGFLSWAPERKLGEAISLENPRQREAIEKMTLAAMPLMEIHAVSDATALVTLVGGPPGTPP